MAEWSDIEKAAVEKLTQYPSLCIEVWGRDFENDPGFKRAVKMMAAHPSRCPRNVIEDCRYLREDATLVN